MIGLHPASDLLNDGMGVLDWYSGADAIRDRAIGGGFAIKRHAPEREDAIGNPTHHDRPVAATEAGGVDEGCQAVDG